MVAHLQAAQAAYQTCETTEAVRLGKGNTESADTILRAVRSNCGPQWNAYLESWPGVPGEEGPQQATRQSTEDSAVAALLNARAAPR